VTTDQKAPHHNASDRSDQTAPDKKEQLDGALEAMARLSFEDLLESQRVAKAIGVLPPDGDLSASVEPRGYRILHKLPRFPPTLIDRLVAHLSTFQSIMHASVADLEQVEGVGEARAKSVKEGLARLAESVTTPDPSRTGVALQTR
jgi:diadenylate cyclase